MTSSTTPLTRTLAGLALLSTLGLGSSCSAGSGFFARLRKDTPSEAEPPTRRTTSLTIQNDTAEGPVSSYALVHHERGDCMHISAHSDCLSGLRGLKARLGSDFLWFRVGEQAYVVKDAATLAQARALFKPAEDLDAQEEALDREEQRMEERRDRLETQQEALDERLERLDEEGERLEDDEGRSHAEARSRLAARRSPLEAELRTLARQMEELDREREGLARRQEELGARQEKASREAERALQQLMQQAVTKGTAKLDRP